MEPIKTTGLLIRSIKVGDYNKMLTFLTPDLGEISVWAKGVRSNKNPLMPLCSELCYSELLLLPSKDTYTLTGGDIIQSFYNLRFDILKLACGIYFADVAGDVCKEGISAREILRLLLNSLYFLENGKKPLAELKAMYEFRLMAEAGLMPSLHECTLCQNTDTSYFSCFAGGTVCKNCLSHDKTKISKEAIKILSGYLSPDLKTAFSQSAGKYINEVSQITENYLRYHIDRKIKTLEYLKALFA